jgi:hypothetical protein
VHVLENMSKFNGFRVFKIQKWYPEPDSNRHNISIGGF